MAVHHSCSAKTTLAVQIILCCTNTFIVLRGGPSRLGARFGASMAGTVKASGLAHTVFIFAPLGLALGPPRTENPRGVGPLGLNFSIIAAIVPAVDLKRKTTF